MIQEYNVDVADPFLKELFDPMPQIQDGHLQLPDTPGLGIDFNEEAAAKYPAKPHDRPVIVESDGAIGLQ